VFPNHKIQWVRPVRAPNTERRGAEVEAIDCRRCGPDKPKLAKPPFRTELGTSIQENICSECWAEWLQHQTLLINHYGLDPRDPKAKEFLYGQIETVLLGGGEGKEVDTSQKGEIEW
jgi:Fe-S cluster biosynthesis and repair protein YggX